MTSVLFHNVNVIDGSGAPPYRANVRVVDQRIAAVTRSDGSRPQRKATARSEGGVEVIECGGATLMPGLIEPHAHLSFVDQATPNAFSTIPVEEHLLLTLKHAKLYLDQGFTSCFSAAATKPRLDVVVRNAINRGEHPGPRLRGRKRPVHRDGRRRRSAPDASRSGRGDVHAAVRWTG